MSAVAISAANLSTLENNLQVLANNIGTVSQNVNTVNGHINDVQGQVNTVKNDVKSLEEEIKAFMLEIKQGTVVSNARQTILMAESEYTKKYGHRDEVRRRVNGLLQSIDINAIKKSTVENISEETIINTPDYWLAPALVSLCAWYTDNKPLAENALKEAMSRDDEKTSLLFCLVHLRANRNETAMKWLNRYLSMQDPTKMESKIITVLDAITSGVFGIEAKKNCLEKVNSWMTELNGYGEIKKTQIDRWERYFREQIEEVDKDEYPYIIKYVQEKDNVVDVIASAQAQKTVLKDFRKIINEEHHTRTSSINKIDNLLHMLVFNYDKEELQLKRDIQKNKHIIDENGDMVKALQEFEKTSIALENENNFYNHITNIAIANGTVNAELNTKKLAIALSKDSIVEGYTRISSVKSSEMLPDLNITINEWNGLTKTGNNESELQKNLESYLDDKFYDEVYGVHLFNIKMLVAIVLGLIGIFLTLKQPILAAVIFCAVLIYNVVEFLRAYSKRETKVKQLNEIKKQHKTLLTNIMAEIVDYYFIYKNSEKDRDNFINYVNSLNYEQYIDNNASRNIIVNGGK
ncbi:MAG: hypothetical protein IJO43_03625 [Bacilli bacterium]|nr:hypothetical protein [Bacilli bacterium]